MRFNEQELLDEVDEELSRPYRDPYGPFYGESYGNPEKMTDTQKKFWEQLHENDIYRFGMVGGKGAAKSFSGSTFCYHWAQEHPNSVGCLVANSKRQARDSGGQHIVERGQQLGFDVEYYRSKKIDGQQLSVFYAIDIDGKGFDAGDTHVVLVRSLEAVKSMEGTEVDYLYIEEIQDGNKGGVQIALSRNRGNAVTPPDEPNPVFIAGMTSSELHWMYELMEDGLGLVPESDFDPDEDDGVLYEPTIFENKKNLGQATIDSYRQMMDPQTAEQHIHAERTSSKDNRVLHQYRDSVHRTGRMSQLCAYYDEYRDVIFMLDFNVRPMTATAWQEKPWSDEWLEDKYVPEFNDYGELERVLEFPVANGEIDVERDEPIEEYDSFEEIARPDTEILAQVDEYEVWPDDEMGGGTEGLMRHIVSDYQEHGADIIINGDARGHHRDTRSSTSDWGIVREYAQRLDAMVIPGLESKMNVKKGVTKYDNPPKEDSINLLNRALMNAEGKTRICFLPESTFESGGAAASCASVERRADGSINDSVDKREGREKRRTHFFDCTRYAAWFYFDGGSPSADAFDQMLDEANENFGPIEKNADADWTPTFDDDDTSGSSWF